MAGGPGVSGTGRSGRPCCKLTASSVSQGLASVFSNRASRKSASRAESNMAEDEGYRNPTEVQMSQLVLPCHTNQRGELSVGQLLKWIDTTACLSGEAAPGTAALPALVPHTQRRGPSFQRRLPSPSATLLPPPSLCSGCSTCLRCPLQVLHALLGPSLLPGGAQRSGYYNLRSLL